MKLEYKIYKDTDSFILNFNNEYYLLLSADIHFTDSMNLSFKEKPKKDKMLYFLDKSSKLKYEHRVKHNLNLLVESKINISKNEFKQLPKSIKNKLRECMII